MRWSAAVNRAEYSFIRVEADEATYDMHIMLRFKIERLLLNRELKVKDVPKVWKAEFQDLFGLTPRRRARLLAGHSLEYGWHGLLPHLHAGQSECRAAFPCRS